MQMNWRDIEVYIFDVDGTLYPQRPVRWHMLLKLMRHVLLHPAAIGELMALYHFRKLREEEQYKASPMEALYEVAARKAGISEERAAEAVQRWMFREPLPLLKKYKYEEIIRFINDRYAAGKQIVFYSDYPALEKVQAMGAGFNRIYVSGTGGLNEQKPSADAMRIILQNTGAEKSKIVYVGDRDRKDGASARIAGLQYYDIQCFRQMLAKDEIVPGT